jgi:hypothetical protein
MLYRNIIILSLILSATLRSASGVELIIVGDSLQKMSNLLGTPMMEYPLNGQMIHKYEECTVLSSNDVVVSVEYHVPINIPEETAESEEPPTIDDIKEQALMNDAESQYLLAYCFQFGKLVDQDYGKAIGWYTKSAMQGHMPAQHNLGFIYMNGKGVARDLEQAYMWALLAAQNGNDSLKKALQYRISEDQMQAAVLRAQLMRALMQAEELTEMQNL